MLRSDKNVKLYRTIINQLFLIETLHNKKSCLINRILII